MQVLPKWKPGAHLQQTIWQDRHIKNSYFSSLITSQPIFKIIK